MNTAIQITNFAPRDVPGALYRSYISRLEAIKTIANMIMEYKSTAVMSATSIRGSQAIGL